MGSASIERYAQWWEGNHFEDAGEVVGWRETRVIRAGDEVSYPLAMMGTRPVGAGSAEHTPTGELESSAVRAARRAKTRLRRYAVANRLTYLWVLTFAPDAGGVQEFDLRAAKRATSAWVRYGLRDALGYQGAYVIGWERHKSGAWHVNVLLGARIDHRLLEVAWGHGNVWVSLFRARPGEGGRDLARRASAYVAKYVAKEFAEAGRYVHRYEVAQGFAVRVVRVFALSASGIIEECGAGPAAYRFDAVAPESGRGPPIVWAAFG